MVKFVYIRAYINSGPAYAQIGLQIEICGLESVELVDIRYNSYKLSFFTFTGK